ncbi:MAG: alcohol dehydrogenase family protein [Alphaproteobacteria bacterium]|nr:alcohol dehydrogenase family protein [Alphaproteobacteria bacterium]
MSADRFEVTDGIEAMTAVVTTGTGGYEKLVYRAVPVPVPNRGEVLIQVLAAGVNNTEINTRLGWYASSVTEGTGGTALEDRADGGWNSATPFPFIQGTDCCGRVVQVGPNTSMDMLGARVLVRSCMRLKGYDDPENVWLGSDFDGAFAQYVTVPTTDVFPVDCDWSDAELATIPCAYGTAENMLHRAGVPTGAHVLVTGASGGVGSATVQLAKRRNCRVTAISSASKAEQFKGLGADAILDRNDDLLEVLGADAVDVVVDNVAGPGFPTLLKVLRRGGRYASSGAIAGPIVQLDMRDMYLKDITLFGSTGWDEPVFRNLISYIERGEIRPLLAKTFPLDQIAAAQAEFMEKRHFGNFVLIPPQPD